MGNTGVADDILDELGQGGRGSRIRDRLNKALAEHDPQGWWLEPDAGSFLNVSALPRRWVPAGPRAHCAWLCFLPGEVYAAAVQARDGSMMLQSPGGKSRMIAVEFGVARAWVGNKYFLLTEGDRLWVDSRHSHLLVPTTAFIRFELVIWPKTHGGAG